MQHDEVQPGDIVQLKSGGRHMTAGKEVYNNPAALTCYWFENATMHKSEVPKVALGKLKLNSPL